MKVENGLIFNRSAEQYHKFRPGYPASMFNTIESVCNPDSTPEILEIGAGTGVATRELIQRFNPDITVVEPGKHLLEIARETCAGYPDIHYIVSTFEDLSIQKRFDWVFVATALHWLNPDTRFEKIAKLLKPGGFLIVCMNHFSRTDDAVYDQIAKIYADFHPDAGPVGFDLRKFQKLLIAQRHQEIIESGFFTCVRQTIFKWSLSLTTDEYTGLLKTFSSNARHPADTMQKFYKAMEACIEDHGSRLTLPVLTPLTIVCKK